MDGYSNFAHDCGCPPDAIPAVYVLTLNTNDFPVREAYVYDPTNWSLLRSFVCDSNSRGLVFVEDQACAFYHNRISFKDIEKWDFLVSHFINGAGIDLTGVLLHPITDVAEIGMYGMTSDGTNIWVMGANTSAGAQGVYKITTGGSLLARYTVGAEVRCHPMEWYDDGKLIAARYDNEGGSLVTSNQYNIFDVYDADTGTLLISDFINTQSLHTLGVGSTGHAWGIMRYNGDFYIGDRWGERLLHFSAAGGFIENISLPGITNQQILTVELGKLSVR